MIYVILALAILAAIYGLTRKKKPSSKGMPVPDEEAAKLLEANVEFYEKLSESEKPQFLERVKTFLNHVYIEGVDVKITNLDKLLVAASAIIPVFRFPDWYYFNISGVLLYPDTFSEKLDFDAKNKERIVLGMVGNGRLEKHMILSVKSLREGFSKSPHKTNTGIHEFVHLIDGSDGSIDGVPERLVQHQYSIPWLKTVHAEMQKIDKNKSDIRAYGGVSESEFFAVASEYFFEEPEKMEEKHPDLYRMLKECFGVGK